VKGNIIKYGVVIALVVSSGGVLMNVSQQVQTAEREVKRYDRKLAAKEESIRVLKAEWAYLNNPARLELLVSSGLSLSAANSMDIISDISNDEESNKEPSVSSPVFAPANHVNSAPLHRDISYVPIPRKSPVNIKNANFNNNNNGGAR